MYLFTGKQESNEVKLHTSKQNNQSRKSFTTWNTPPFPGKSSLHTGGILSLLVLLTVIFGSSLLVGCDMGGSGSTSNGSGTGSGNAAATSVPALTSNIQSVREAVISKVRAAVVQINVTLQKGASLGSGVIIDPSGYIVTNNHVVSGAQTVTVAVYGRPGPDLTAQVTGTDPADDLAVLKINPSSTKLTAATLGNSAQLVVGQDVMAIGNPLGITQTVTNGIVSATGRIIPEGQNGALIVNAVQTDAAINPGNSGGALVDLQGNVIGIPTLTAIDPEFNAPASGVGFAIPSNRVKFIAPQIIQTGRVTHSGRAFMGVNVEPVDAAIAAKNNLAVDHGALIVNVASNGPAQRAGLKPGDVIVQVGNTAVNDTSSLLEALLTHNPGDTVPVKVYRGSQQLTVNVTLGELQVGSGS